MATALEGWTGRPGALYVQLADAIGEALATRRIAAHLPSERAMAEALRVSRGTVANAYELLRERGLLTRERGSGTIGAPSRAHDICADPLECVRGFFAAADR